MRTAQMQAIIDELSVLQATRYGEYEDYEKRESLEAQLAKLCGESGYKPVGDWGRWQIRNHLGHIQDNILFPRKAHETAKLQRKPHVAMLRRAQAAKAKELVNERKLIRERVQQRFDNEEADYHKLLWRMKQEVGQPEWLNPKNAPYVREHYKRNRRFVLQGKPTKKYSNFCYWDFKPPSHLVGVVEGWFTIQHFDELTDEEVMQRFG